MPARAWRNRTDAYGSIYTSADRRDGDDLRDACLIASAQKLEHHEIAAYAILDEERRADKLLTDLAKSEVNHDAVAA